MQGNLAPQAKFQGIFRHPVLSQDLIRDTPLGTCKKYWKEWMKMYVYLTHDYIVL